MSNKVQTNDFSLLIGLSQKQQQSDRAASTRYPRLHRFRQELEESKLSPNHKPYQIRHKAVLFYRSVFFALGALFLGLFGLSYGQNMNWTSSILFENSHILKVVICGICLLFSASAFGVGLSIRTEKDAVTNLMNRAEKKLKRINARKNVRLNSKTNLSGEEIINKRRMIQEIYIDTREKMQEAREIASTLLEEISQAKQLEVPIELYNQAILELNERLNFLIQRFKNILNEDFDL